MAKITVRTPWAMSWEKFHKLTNKIADRYQEEPITLIIGIQRGGLIPATILSHKLKVPMQCLEWQTRDGDFRNVAGLLRTFVEPRDGKILFIDDMWDSGKTLREIKQYMTGGNYEVAVLIDRLGDEDLVNFSAWDKEMVDDIYKYFNWITFPWETRKN